MREPLILVTNDDGITSPGIRCLIDVMKTIGKVVVVAPDRVRSAVGHAITVAEPLRLEKIKDNDRCKEYVCDGTPADCVKMALNIVLDSKPDLIVSGINHGSNASSNVIYSGTMSAAIEGAVESILSIGFSVTSPLWDIDISAYKKYVKIITKNVLKNGLPKGICLNVNIPDIKEEDIKGVKVCRQANARWIEGFEKRKDPHQKDYYWLNGTFEIFDDGHDTDEWALKNDYVSIVPVQFDLTAYNMIQTIKNWRINV